MKTFTFTEDNGNTTPITLDENGFASGQLIEEVNVRWVQFHDYNGFLEVEFDEVDVTFVSNSLNLEGSVDSNKDLVTFCINALQAS